MKGNAPRLPAVLSSFQHSGDGRELVKPVGRFGFMIGATRLPE